MSAKQVYIITGAPSTGKTSVIEALKERGYLCHEEIARKVIKQNMEEGVDVFPWNNMRAFSDQVLDTMLEQKVNLDTSKVNFLDRGVIDLVGYMNFANESYPSSYIDEANKMPYSKTIFFMPFWEEIYEQDKERKESSNEGKEIGDALFSAYEEAGFNLVTVPKLEVEARVDFILDFVFANNC